jgi:hypothetical protein
VPQCEGKQCGDDGCGGDCGPCDAGEQCDVDVCVADPCAGASNGTLCDDGNGCTRDDRCVGGRCSGLAILCDDGDACTRDRCDAAQGDCTSEPIEGCCERDRDCDDGDPCTQDRCGVTGCVAVALEGCASEDVTDGGAITDAGVTDGGMGFADSSDCGCRAVGIARSSLPGPFVWLLIALGLAGRRWLRAS